ncbi:MAG: LacI family DNA-binding transcriptional regulator [Bacteroidota bacterium]
MGRVTIKDVATEAGVAISTVSLVINDKGYVSPETRSRVLTVATQLGYLPTRAARELASHLTGNVGFILREDHFTRSEPFYTRVFLGTEFGARNESLYVLLATVPRNYDPNEHRPRFLRERTIDGLLIAGKVGRELLDDVARLDIPVVLIDFEYESYPSVVIDNRGGARAAVEHLLEQGHERIAFVGADIKHPSLRKRLEGYQQTITSRFGAIDERLILTEAGADPTRDTGGIIADRMVDLDPRPTAVFCANDALALGFIDRVRAEGLVVPDDLAVVGFDDVAGSADAPIGLSSVRVFTEQLGELGLRTLLELTRRENGAQPSYARGAHVVTVPTELVVRASSRYHRH